MLNNGKINQFEVIPSKILKTDGNIKDIIGDDAEYNKNKILEVFSGSKNALLEIIALNSAAALVVCEKENDLKTAYEKMYSFISSKSQDSNNSMHRSIQLHDALQTLQSKRCNASAGNQKHQTQSNSLKAETIEHIFTYVLITL